MNAHEATTSGITPTLRGGLMSMRRNARRGRRGFSLVELMIVVAITGILAAIAIPTFTGYLHKARASEATQFLGVIKLKQEAYRAEFGTYLQFAGGTSPADPNVETDAPGPRISDANFVPNNWDALDGATIAFPTGTPFDVLGAKPDGPVRFGYGWAAGLPGDAGPNGLLLDPYRMTGADHYFVAQAIADLDGDLDDGGDACLFELTSFTRGVWFTPAKGWE